ncbi:aldose epimerase (plasmid) [Frondihabitans sp. PAMC 28766]|uniref:aldose 1-epimerase family protein n=1 Tax=Frondihabitans sp. PAMC 28766 TaxID=1795630 RepID=UPI00078DB0AC|nr:aldose 1-epimerase family protein [Frondihabitans sp. PAMC 28766]AMM22635.1 aldose epimerase [Frondihabitans sp. PAMC 28766]
MSVFPSGDQFEIRHGEQRATIVQVGGGIRSYTHSGRDVLQPYAAAVMRDGAHGTPLIPWPNRLADGRYTFNGTDYQVALTEPTTHTAIHGFLSWRPWIAIEHEEHRVVMAVRLFPLEGYPFVLDVRIEYTLGPDGLTVTTTARNSGQNTLPYGCGQHPYLSPGAAGQVDDCILQLEATTRITTDPERELPTGTEPVAGTAFDFRAPKKIGDVKIDFAFTGLARDSDARAWVHLTGQDQQTASLWVDHTYSFIELYTADTLEEPRRRKGLGSEPMTCPPNAYATGENLIRLPSGESITTTWGARLSDTSTLGTKSSL